MKLLLSGYGLYLITACDLYNLVILFLQSYWWATFICTSTLCCHLRWTTTHWATETAKTGNSRGWQCADTPAPSRGPPGPTRTTPSSSNSSRLEIAAKSTRSSPQCRATKTLSRPTAAPVAGIAKGWVTIPLCPEGAPRAQSTGSRCLQLPLSEEMLR